MNISTFQQLPTVQQMIVFFITFLPTIHYAHSIAKLSCRHFGDMTPKVMKNILADLVKKEVLGHDDDGHFIKGQIDMPTLREIVHTSDTHGWWPSPRDVQSLCQKKTYYSNNEREALILWAVMQLIRGMVGGFAPLHTNDFAAAFKLAPHSVSRGAASWLLTLCPDEPEWQNISTIPRHSIIWQEYLNLAFLRGHDVRRTLADIAEHKDVNGPTDGLVKNYLALCVWTNWREGLGKPFAREFVGAPLMKRFEILFSGDFATVDKLFRNDLTPLVTGYDTLPLRFLTMMIAIAADPKKTPKTRIARMADVQEDDDELLDYSEVIDDANEEIDNLLYHWSTHWNRTASGAGEQISQLYRVNYNYTMFHLLEAFDYHFLPAHREKFRPQAQALAQLASFLFNKGYLNLTGLFLSLTFDGINEADYTAPIQEMNNVGLWLLPLRKAEPDWKNLVGELKKLIAKSDREKQRQLDSKNQHSAWLLELENASDDPNGNTYVIKGIELFLLDDPQNFNSAKPIPLQDLKRNNCSSKQHISEKDNLIAKTLLASNTFSYFGTRPPDEVLELLADMDNLFTTEYRWGHNNRPVMSTPKPISIKKEALTLETTLGNDGSLTLGMPAWLSEQTRTTFLHKVDDNHYSLINISKEYRRFIDVFENFGGSKLSVTIPREGVADSADVIEGITRIIPLSKPSDDQKAALPHRAAATDLVMRLDYANGTLTARALIRPIAENPTLTFEPGHGTPERIGAGPLGPYLLIRDLDAERAAFEPLQNAMRPFEDFFDGTATWKLNEISTALDALTVLKSHEPAIVMEWIENQRLNITYAPRSGIALTSSRTAEDWLSIKGTFTLDNGLVLSVAQLLEAASSREGRYVRLSDGDYLALTQTMARELDALHAASRRKGDAVEITRAAMPMIDDTFAADTNHEAIPLPDEFAKNAEEIRQALAIRPRVPTTLNAELRPYQKDGYRWLARLANCGFGACLADDMGLGKTLQIIAVLLEHAGNGPSLVVAPSSVCGNWRRELHRFAPTLNPILVQESPESLVTAAPRQVLISSYGYLLFHEKDFTGIDWNGLVLDEAQSIKNDASRRAHVVKRFHAKFRIAATGTPVENRLGDLWSLFDFLNPGLLGPAASFLKRLAPDGKASSALKRMVKPLILRRLKGDVLDDLPEKTEVTLPIELGPDERSAYEGCRLHALSSLKEGNGDKERSRISILAELTRLRRFCCHPSLVLGSDSSIPSAKMDALEELLEKLRQGRHRALVFSQFTDYLAIVRQMLDRNGWNYKYLDGTTPTLEREHLVNDFQNGNGDFFLISLKAGGTGLNLTSANYVILLDPWWNPAVENQAADRAHRIGQTQPVTIYRLVASDTVEERVIELHQEKNALAADILDGTSSPRFSPEDLLKLFK